MPTGSSFSSSYAASSETRDELRASIELNTVIKKAKYCGQFVLRKDLFRMIIVPADVTNGNHHILCAAAFVQSEPPDTFVCSDDYETEILTKAKSAASLKWDYALAGACVARFDTNKCVA
jgi:hypothetical protein